MSRTGIFALCAVLVPKVAASYGVRLSAIPEAYWGTWVTELGVPVSESMECSKGEKGTCAARFLLLSHCGPALAGGGPWLIVGALPTTP